MKKALLIASVLISAFAGNACGQNVNNTIKINPLSALLKVGSMFYERKVADNSTLQLGVAYIGMNIESTKYSGVAITPEYRHYLAKNATDGGYIGPFLKYLNYTVDAGTDKGSYASFGGGVLVGRQWVFNSGFTLDLFFGPSFNSGKYKVETGIQPFLSGADDGFGLRTGIALGVGF